MGLLERIFGRKSAPGAVEVELPPCPHVALSARWDEAADMGKEDLASHYLCVACQERFTPEEVAALRATEGERLRAEMETRSDE